MYVRTRSDVGAKKEWGNRDGAWDLEVLMIFDVSLRRNGVWRRITRGGEWEERRRREVIVLGRWWRYKCNNDDLQENIVHRLFPISL